MQRSSTTDVPSVQPMRIRRGSETNVGSAMLMARCGSQPPPISAESPVSMPLINMCFTAAIRGAFSFPERRIIGSSAEPSADPRGVDGPAAHRTAAGGVLAFKAMTPGMRRHIPRVTRPGEPRSGPMPSAAARTMSMRPFEEPVCSNLVCSRCQIGSGGRKTPFTRGSSPPW